MKTSVFISAFIVVLLMGCNPQKQTAKELLANPEFRTTVFNEVINNEAYLSEFTGQLSANDNCRKVCTHDVQLMKTAWESDRMDSLLQKEPLVAEVMARRMVRRIENDTTVCRNVCDVMMGSEQFRKIYSKHLQQKAK